MINLGLIVLGFVTGILGGVVGIGGGIVLVPALVIFFGFQQHLAQGTTMAALIPPVGILAAYIYYRNGNVNIMAAGMIAIGFLFGGLFGAKLANQVSRESLQRIFGVLLLVIGTKFLFFKAK